MWTLSWSWNALAPSSGRVDVRNVSGRQAAARGHDDDGGGGDNDADGGRDGGGGDDPDDVAPAVEPEPDRQQLFDSEPDARPE